MLYEVSYMSAAGIPSILHVNADSSERAQAYFCETEAGAEFCGIREGASSSRPGVPSVTVPADWQPCEIGGEKSVTVYFTPAEIGRNLNRDDLKAADKIGTGVLEQVLPDLISFHDVEPSELPRVLSFIGSRFGLHSVDVCDCVTVGCRATESNERRVEIETAAAPAPAETGSDNSASAPAPVRLADLIPYRSKVTVYVPSTVNVNEASDNSAQVERVARLLSECFGGATASPASGYWVAADKSLVVEHTTMVFAYCDTAAAEKYIDDVVRLCYSLKIEMGQEAIALEYNGEMYFI